MTERTLAIGDIHGCDVALDTLLSHLAITADDTVVVLGDVVDRGPASSVAIERLLELSHSCRLVFLLGNHEEMMLDALAGGQSQGAWLQYGGRETLQSYGGNPDRIPPDHIDFLGQGLDYWETDREIFIHANLEPGVALDEQSPEWLRWTHLTGFEFPHPSGKRVICGHTAQQTGVPLNNEGWVCIDTWVYGKGWLTCLNLETDEFLQAQQNGTFRSGLTLSDIG